MKFPTCSKEKVAWYKYFDRRVSWSDRFKMNEIYERAGVNLVFHIVPLYGANVCGLHVPCNLVIVERRFAYLYWDRNV